MTNSMSGSSSATILEGVNDPQTRYSPDSRLMKTLQTLVDGRARILVSGPLGSGKTTLLQALSGMLCTGRHAITLKKSPNMTLGALLPNKHTYNVDVEEITEHDLAGLHKEYFILGDIASPAAAMLIARAGLQDMITMGTIVSDAPDAAVGNLTSLLCNAGGYTRYQAARVAADIFDVVVQFFCYAPGEPPRMVTISEIKFISTAGEPFEFLRWRGNDDSFEMWPPSRDFIAKLRRHNPTAFPDALPDHPPA